MSYGLQTSQVFIYISLFLGESFQYILLFRIYMELGKTIHHKQSIKFDLAEKYLRNWVNDHILCRDERYFNVWQKHIIITLCIGFRNSIFVRRTGLLISCTIIKITVKAQHNPMDLLSWPSYYNFWAGMGCLKPQAARSYQISEHNIHLTLRMLWSSLWLDLFVFLKTSFCND